MKNDLSNNITEKELEKIQESLKVTREEKEKWTVSAKKEKQEIAKYAAFFGVRAASKDKFQPKFPNLAVRPWVKGHKKSIQEQKKKKGETTV